VIEAAPIAHAEPFPALPELPGRPGKRRQVGVEIEFGALAPDKAARLVALRVGGRPKAVSAAEWHVDGSDIGRVEIILDTALRPSGTDPAAEAGVALARQVVPVEIVTEPIAQRHLARIDRLCRALRLAGAEGSRSHVVHGFGLHLNVELADPDGGTDLPRITRAFALLEPWLRKRDPFDLSRRVLPFTRSFPEDFVDAAARLHPGATPDEVFDLIDTHIGSRNYGLDLLPAYGWLAPDRFARHSGARASVSARPAYHYRMPESRIDEPQWSLSYEWRRWWLVEQVAARADLLDRLSAAWTGSRAQAVFGNRERYCGAVTDALGPLAALAPDGGPPPGTGSVRRREGNAPA
jgi:hypothetical protein